MTNYSFLEHLYQHLPLNGSDSLFVTFNELSLYQKFIEMIELTDEEYFAFEVGLLTPGNIFGCRIVWFKYFCISSKSCHLRKKFKVFLVFFQIVQQYHFSIQLFIQNEVSSTTWHFYFPKDTASFIAVITSFL